MITLESYLLISVFMFSVGIWIMIARKNIIAILLGIEMILNAAALNFVAYSKFVTKDSYCIVFDTIVNEMPKSIFEDRPWGPRNNPKIAVKHFLKKNKNFVIDEEINDKLMISVAPDGYLKKII